MACSCKASKYLSPNSSSKLLPKTCKSVPTFSGKYRFSVSASKIKFDGFLSVYKDDDEKSENKALIHGISEESQVSLADVKGELHFTQPPAHYTEASLVKQLEELGIEEGDTVKMYGLQFDYYK